MHVFCVFCAPRFLSSRPAEVLDSTGHTQKPNGCVRSHVECGKLRHASSLFEQELSVYEKGVSLAEAG